MDPAPERVRRAARDEPFAAVEALVVGTAVAWSAGAVLLLGPAASADLGTGLLRFAAGRAVLVPVGLGLVLSVVLLVHAARDAWRLWTAGPGERLPGSAAGLARAGWRVAETAAAPAYLLLVPPTLLVVALLPDAEQVGGLFLLSGAFVVLATAGLLGVVGTRIVATAAHRGLRRIRT